MAVKSSDLQDAINRAVDFLYEQQLPSGEFPSYFSQHPTMDECTPDSTPFPTALMSYSINFHDSPKVKKMIEKTIPFFLSHMESGAVWRYWTYKHAEHKNIPPDVDDTACVSQVLSQHKIPFPDNRQVLLANRNRENLFYTWFVPRLPAPRNLTFWRVALKTLLDPINFYAFWKITEASPNDVDGVVNANALFYLGVNDETENVVRYLKEIVAKNRESSCDKWHLSPFNLYYFLSRNFHQNAQHFDGTDAEIVYKVENKANEDGSIGRNTLETALAACTLMNCKRSSTVLEKAVDHILDAQEPRGAWRKVAMYYAGPKFGGPDQYFGWGSEELTTAFCIEALTRYAEYDNS